ncbi:MAG: phenylalanine--tRNA ligase subunit beta [Candidatus Omnitrophica bacterium]|nr:phenylalanine--tRNA ligase subunit beta [Candidatus Omnitrophota bacterium]MBU1869014.1 phenylalanine--tRNA ligase subunit beta [Candidatus Omnitrophota bacterium]
MKFTYNWLKDFVDVKLSPQALAERLTMTGLEVTSLDEREGDFIFEIEITSNRPDWLSVVGIAREVAAITGKKLKAPHLRSKGTGKLRRQLPFSIKIEDKKDCPLYTAKIMHGVKVGPSPDWLKKRLELIGCRSINNIVDITNYILFTYGEPLHAFDLDKMASQSGIIVRRAQKAEEIVAIDGEKRILDEDILVIACASDSSIGRPVAIAGVMGGKDTEVTEGTVNILLEAAVFNQVVIRKARQKLALQTDSSYRFERGLDSETAVSASWKAVDLIQDLAGGNLALSKEYGLMKAKGKVINLDLELTNDILGVEIPAFRVKQILESLDFKVKAGGKNRLVVAVPSHRQDSGLPEDLIEEISRVFGFENIPMSLPLVLPRPTIRSARDLVSIIKHTLAALGLNEVITYSLVDKGLLEAFHIDAQTSAPEIQNPLSIEQEVLRPLLAPSLARCLAHNLNQRQESVDIFEVANTFNNSPSGLKQELCLAIALCGTKRLLLESGVIDDKSGFLHLKGVMEALFERLAIGEYDFAFEDNSSIIGISVAGEKIGMMFSPEKSSLEKIDIKNKDVFIAELSLDALLAKMGPARKFIPLPKYPAITRDSSFILKEDILVQELINVAIEKGQPFLKHASVTDYYKGKQIPEGYRGLTISCVYRSDSRTLTEEEVAPVHSQICAALSEQFGAKLRQG